MSEPSKFRVLGIDNFHNMEDDNTYEHGQFETYEVALAAAKKIVEESVANHKYDLNMHRQFGDDAILQCPAGTEHPQFKAWEYAAELCARHGKEGGANITEPPPPPEQGEGE